MPHQQMRMHSPLLLAVRLNSGQALDQRIVDVDAMYSSNFVVSLGQTASGGEVEHSLALSTASLTFRIIPAVPFA
jgi:hypothetical protein